VQLGFEFAGAALEVGQGRGEFLLERGWETIPGPRTFGLQQSDELARCQEGVEPPQGERVPLLSYRRNAGELLVGPGDLLLGRNRRVRRAQRFLDRIDKQLTVGV